MSGIYIHIPFCVKKCLYCDFISGIADDNIVRAYFTKLQIEILVRARGYKQQIETIYFGGGTPSSVDSSFIVDTLTIVKQQFNVNENAEITIEINPGTVDASKMVAYRKAGFNRISIGLQSAHENELKTLGRIHSVKDFVNTYKMAENAGFDNINVDLMSAIPGQTIESYRENIEFVARLKPTHISSYSLIIEKGTPFYDMYKNKEIINEDDERRMYVLTNEMLKSYGYERYEISNYCKKGYESRHNSAYWQRKEYLGFGVAAASLVENVRTTNTTNINEYINSDKFIYLEENTLSKKEQMEEFVFLGLRMMKGISVSHFNKTFDADFGNLYKNTLEKMIKMHLIEWNGDIVRLTEKGIDVSNIVMSEFLL